MHGPWTGGGASGRASSEEESEHTDADRGLGGRYLVRGGGGRSGFSLRLGTARLGATAGLSALATVATRRGRRRQRRVLRRVNARVRDMHSTGSGLKCRRNVLATESNLIEAVGQSPRVVTNEGVNGLPD